MQHIAHLVLSSDFLKALKVSFNTITKELINEMTRHKHEINMLLTGYYCQERGAVHNHVIDPDTVDIDAEGKGSYVGFRC
jgi:hypothetical protein